MQQLWDNTLFSIRRKLDTHQFNHWFKPIKCESVTDDEILLKVPDRFFQEWIQDNYFELLREELLQQADRDISIRFIYGAQGASGQTEAKRTPENCIPLEKRYTFDSFVVGASNQFAHAACEAVADSPGHTYNPLFIYGGVGLGKTHLLHAIGNKILADKPNAKITYIASETYINDLITSIRRERMDEFRAKYRKSCDVLLVDDIQFIAGKDRTQVEFFHTFNSLYAAHKQIVVTSDRFPQEISGLEERLKSRFQWGLIADVQPPELETRVAILKAKAATDGIDLPEEVAMFLAQHIKSNVRELEGSLIRLAAHARLNNVPIDLSTVRVVLRDLLVDPGPAITIQQIQKLVANYFNVTVSDLKGGRRHRAIALPRMIAMFLTRQHTRSSFPEIGKKFGNRDHSTVISAVKKIERLTTVKPDDFVKRALRDLERSLIT
ncbi:MAG TPA: chromosomal replication initiator protein DnaA [Myxococcales bacterium]|nr:chromosomal replication initiator protein DnaA [Myxococcales bacterium]